MSRPLTRSQRVLIFAIGLTVVVGVFVPARWMAPWTGLLAGAVSVPVQPLGDFGIRATRWLWPPDDPLAGEPELVQHLTEQLEIARQLAHSKQSRIEELEEQLRELQQARSYHRGGQVDTIYARVTGRAADRGGGLVRVNVGSRHGVPTGAVAVFRGVHLIGRVAEEPGALSAWVLPVTDPAIGFIEVALIDPDDPDPALDTHVQLRPDGRGGLVGDVDKSLNVEPGDVAELFDHLWPASAQGMKVGLVESVTPKDEHPLLSTVVVKPQYEAHRLPSVTLKVERTDLAAAEGGGG